MNGVSSCFRASLVLMALGALAGQVSANLTLYASDVRDEGDWVYPARAEGVPGNDCSGNSGEFSHCIGDSWDALTIEEWDAFSLPANEAIVAVYLNVKGAYDEGSYNCAFEMLSYDIYTTPPWNQTNSNCEWRFGPVGVQDGSGPYYGPTDLEDYWVDIYRTEVVSENENNRARVSGARMIIQTVRLNGLDFEYDEYGDYDISLDMGVAAPGAAVQRTFTVVNNGDLPFYGDTYFDPAPGFESSPFITLEPADLGPYTLAAGHQRSFTVTYSNPGCTDYCFDDAYVYLCPGIWISVFGKTESEVDVATEELPPAFALLQPSPNPFNPSTRIELSLPSPGEFRLSVVNVLGQQVAALFNGSRPAGTHSFTWTPANLASGSYFVVAESGGKRQLQRVLFIK
jgi:hypothetical protein